MASGVPGVRRRNGPSRLRLVVAGAAEVARDLETLGTGSAGAPVEVVATAGSHDEALRVAADTGPDLVLVGSDLPAPGWIGCITSLCRDAGAGGGVGGGVGAKEQTDVSGVTEVGRAAVIGLSGDDDSHSAAQALQAGAAAVLPTATRAYLLVGPMLAVSQGWRVLPGSVLDQLLAPPIRTGGRAPGGSDPLAAFDDEERQLWRLVASGLEIAAIAQQLYVSERTTKRLVANLRDRLGVRTRIEMAAMAGRSGLLDEPAVPGTPE